MAGFLWSNLALVFLVLAVVFRNIHAKPAGRSARGLRSQSAELRRLDVVFKEMDFDLNNARDIYYDCRIRPANPVVIQNITQKVHLDGNETAEDILRSFIQEIDKFRNPVYLAYFDEDTRADSNKTVSWKLRMASRSLNRTYSCATQYVFPTLSKKAPPPENLQWTRAFMENKIKSQKNPSFGTASIQEVRSYATFEELRYTQSELRKLLERLLKMV